MFKAKYFPSSSIWEATTSDNSSYSGVGILWLKGLDSGLGMAPLSQFMTLDGFPHLGISKLFHLGPCLVIHVSLIFWMNLADGIFHWLETPS